jgi:hypothetical protein
MGDMADWHMENAQLSAWGADPDARDDKPCKYCNVEDLYWTITPKGWRLVDTKDRLHDCRALNKIRRLYSK